MGSSKRAGPRCLAIAAAMAVVAPTAAQVTAPAPAASANDGAGIGDIVVTASKRSERSQDVPITITAVSGADLIARGILDPVSLTKTVPGLNAAVVSGYGGKLNYTLRGVGLNTYSEVQESAVAVYQDEVYIASPIGATFSLFDIDRVEVLRGPQGTLFGRSASGGLINYVSTPPGKSADGYLTAGLGSYGERLVEAAQDLPLDAEGANAVRAAFRYYGSDGFLDNDAGGKNLEGGDLYTGRVQLRLAPTPDLRVVLRGEYGQFDSDHAAGYRHVNSYVDGDGVSRLLGPDENVYGTPGGDLFGYRNDGADFFSTESDTPSLTYTKRTLLSGRADYDLGGATLTAVSGYMDVRERYLEDTDGSPISFITYGIRNRSKEFQQEVRLAAAPGSALRWTVGAFYFDYRVHYDTIASFPTGLTPLGITSPIDLRSIADQKRHSFAGYGRVEVPVADRLQVAAGIRAERERATFTYRQQFDPEALATAILGVGPVQFSPATDGDLARIRKTYYSGDVTINYRPTDRVLLYAAVKRGIKPGGFSTPIAGIPPDRMRFDEEKLDAVEAGIKSDWLGGRLRVNAAAFHYWYNGYQAVQFKDTQTYTGNADARVSGLDAELVWAPARSIELGASGGYVHAVARDIPLVGANGVQVRNRDLPNAPRVSLNGYAQYRTGLAGGELSLRADLLYRSRTYFEIQNNPALRQGGYGTVDLSARWAVGRWSASVTAANVFNRKYIAYVQDNSSFGFVDYTPGKPRWVTLQVTRRW